MPRTHPHVGTYQVGSPAGFREGVSESLELMLRHARDRPEALAIKDDDEALTYAELCDQVARAAFALDELGVRPGDRVALHLPSSVGFVVSARRACGRVRPGFPWPSMIRRRADTRLVEDCAPRLVLSLTTARGFSKMSSDAGGCRIVDLASLRAASGSPPAPVADPGRGVYMIYTSGTTGVPKGVRILEGAFRSAITNTAHLLGVNSTTRTLSVSPFHFDGSYGSLFPTLVAGGSVIMPRREDLLFLRRFFRAVVEEEITHAGLSPSYLRLLLASGRLSSLAHGSLKSMGLGEEELLAQDVADLWRALPGLRIFNRYGPTETTIEVTTSEVLPHDVHLGTVPIGTPHPGVSFHLRSESGHWVSEPDETGELYIGGCQLMAGYWADPELTREVMRDDVLPGQVVYRTGDLVYRDRSDRYIYAGRTNDVVKRNGIRLSLTEIDRALRRVEAVTDASCVLLGEGGHRSLVAFVVAPSETSAQHIRAAAAAELPATMLPDQIFFIAAMPLTSSGKVDRRRLIAEAARG